MAFSVLFLLLLAQSDPQHTTNTGIKITTRYSSQGGLVTEQTVYVQGDRRRLEFRNAAGGRKRADGTIGIKYGPRMVSIQRCDLGQAFELNLDAREYYTAPFPPKPLTPEQSKARGLGTGLKYSYDQPTIRVEQTTTDTGERKQIFGRVARHVITTSREVPLEGSHSQPSKTIKEGWYIDLDTRISCDRRYPSGGGHAYAFIVAGNPPIERRTVVATGKQETGFPIQLKITSRGTTVFPDGTKKESILVSETLVTELEERPLDPALFEVPSGFRKVEDIRRNPLLPTSTSSWASLKEWINGLFR